MLLAMYYNGYVIICIVIGAGLGKFLCEDVEGVLWSTYSQEVAEAAAFISGSAENISEVFPIGINDTEMADNQLLPTSHFSIAWAFGLLVNIALSPYLKSLSEMSL
ncbi:hypothetical protein QBC46DRAFT_416564 [Diplogelasinospora grovesii]|uniref:Copper transport protein n=1 Tax=Diplogelasinospora grovesii TaxID=303347 RepID=A0AAN6S255_9PEZI|nr:hypothetical protein QBC46DRAFT_416564 [Diplogelasinospora grovesii]